MESAIKKKQLSINVEEYEMPEEAKITKIINTVKSKKESNLAYSDHSDSYSDGYGAMF